MPLQTYLNHYYQTIEQFALACDITSKEVDILVNEQLIPEPSYTVISDNKCISQAFGELTSNELTIGEYFHPRNKIWVNLAIKMKIKVGSVQAHANLKQQFKHNFAIELQALDIEIFRLSDSFTDNGHIVQDGLEQRTETAWGYFLKGVFSLCVADPSSEKSIATKEVLQEALITLTDNGLKNDFDKKATKHILYLIEQYEQAAMPFSPIEYPNSSRKRLVEDLRAKLVNI